MESAQAANAVTGADDLLYDIRGDVGYIIFNRPAARNALTFTMYERLTEICASVGATDTLRALVLSGAGAKAFAAGTDINQFRAFSSAEDAVAYERRIDKVLTAIEDCPVPTIAAICGACTGGGAAIAAVCDLRIATADTRFGFPIARTLGNCLSPENYARLTALIGPARVKELIFTARLMSAEEMLRVGLCTEVLPDRDAMMARAAELAATVADHAPLTLRVTKEVLARLARLSRIEAEDLILKCYLSADFREGMDAFLTKRRPNWRGR
jgi:enoyl-CoA hydratase